MPSNAQYWAIAFTVLSIATVLPYIMKLFGGNQFDVKGKTVLLTGASEGMGKSVAVQLAQKGANVIIVARNVTKLETALGEVKSAAADPSTQRFMYISADMSVDDAATRVIAEATAWNNEKSLDVVWCIAGSAFPSLFLESSKSKARQQMDTNYWSCWDMAQATLGQWLHPSATKGTRRHLIFTSSVIAFYGIAGYASYGPAKTAIKSLSDTLAQEVLLYGDDIKIHTVFPATIQSPGLETENLTKPDITCILEESDPVQTPEVVAANAIKGLEKGEYLVTVGWLGDAMRACAWGGSKRNSWVLDTLMTWITAIIWLFVGPDLDGKVRSYGKKHGHPSTYPKKS